eukprot:6173534-Pleurochrysis_carterae.AAC.1
MDNRGAIALSNNPTASKHPTSLAVCSRLRCRQDHVNEICSHCAEHSGCVHQLNFQGHLPQSNKESYNESKTRNIQPVTHGLAAHGPSALPMAVPRDRWPVARGQQLVAGDPGPWPVTRGANGP